jgi:hypothetical protein
MKQLLQIHKNLPEFIKIRLKVLKDDGFEFLNEDIESESIRNHLQEGDCIMVENKRILVCDVESKTGFEMIKQFNRWKTKNKPITFGNDYSIRNDIDSISNLIDSQFYQFYQNQKLENRPSIS